MYVCCSIQKGIPLIKYIIFRTLLETPSTFCYINIWDSQTDKPQIFYYISHFMSCVSGHVQSHHTSLSRLCPGWWGSRCPLLVVLGGSASSCQARPGAASHLAGHYTPTHGQPLKLYTVDIWISVYCLCRYYYI